MASEEKIKDVIRDNWRREIEASRTYRALAETETDGKRKAILTKMAAMEERHASRWEEELKLLGEGALPTPDMAFEKELKRRLLGQGAAEEVIREMEAAEDLHAEEYRLQVEALGAERYSALLDAIANDEKDHANMLRGLQARPGKEPREPRARLDSILRLERWHVSTGNWVGDAIYGVNDGLGAVFGIVSGIAGYTGGGHFVLVSGLAGMLASALSMGSGAYLATKSEREVFEAEMTREHREIEENPDEEKEELSLFYQLKGLSEEEADQVVSRMAENKDVMLKALAHEELGLSQDAFPSPTTAAVSASISTGVGALVPIIPFFFMHGYPAILLAAVISLVAHFAVGAAKSLITVRSWWKSGLEMTIVGAIEAAITFGIGLAFAHL